MLTPTLKFFFYLRGFLWVAFEKNNGLLPKINMDSILGEQNMMLFVWRLECSILSLIYSYYYYSENFLQARIFFEQLNFERVVESVSYKVDMI